MSGLCKKKPGLRTLYHRITTVEPPPLFVAAVPAAAPVEGAEPHVPGPTPPTREPSPRMAHFKQFLETRGSALAHTPAFLAYYALPYVPQPERHPAFEGLYEKRWVRVPHNWEMRKRSGSRSV